MKDFPEFILASRSPRRRQLLEEAGYCFHAMPARLEEPHAIPPDASPTQFAEALAYFKARAVQEVRPEMPILAADTIVACQGTIYGKPEDAFDARCILSTLSGTTHQVITGVALLLPHLEPVPDPCSLRLIASETTSVTMRALTRKELDDYIASGEWHDKAGAYAIQETADAFVEKIDGSFSNIVGLPMELVDRLTAKAREMLTQQV
jgi:septum formation protein